MKQYIKQWFKDLWTNFSREFANIFSDGGVLIIFIVAGLLYPLLFNFIYKNGVLEDAKIAVVDMADCAESRNYTRELDATRELKVVEHCTSMEEAQRLLQKRKVNGIVYFPEDFGKNLARLEPSTISIYADMSSFLYYKNLLMGTNFVMLDEMHRIEIERCEATGMTLQEAKQFAQPVKYEENNPYNRTFSYSIFFLAAILLVIIQQTMFYGMSLLAGTMREEKRSFALLAKYQSSRGVARLVLGRGLAYWILYMAIGIYIAVIVPALFGLPQRGSFLQILILLMFFVTDCVFFGMSWSSLFTRRESVFVLLLFMSPVALFLTGFSWPVTAFPKFWRIFSYILPTTFGVPAYINMNTAGGDILLVKDLFGKMILQTMIYAAISFVAVYVENFIIDYKSKYGSLI